MNTTASFHRGWIGLLRNDLVLTIGMPLVAALNLQQFAGALAHELGHFTQGTGMRFSYIIFSVNAWFASANYERDAMDIWLERMAQKGHAYLAPILLVSHLCIGLTRKILYPLMVVGHRISSALLQQMELDADCYQIGLIGSEAFVSTLQQLHLWHLAQEKASPLLEREWAHRRVPDNWPEFFRMHYERLPEDAVIQVDKAIQEEQTDRFATHPSDRDRIQRAREENAAVRIPG
jgi:Zn-dependent protease with chaperone function